MPKLVSPSRRLAQGLLAAAALTGALVVPGPARAEDPVLQGGVPDQAGGSGALVEKNSPIGSGGGTVMLNAATARTAARNAVNISGAIEAHSIGGRSGSIIIGGDDGGPVTLPGAVDASRSVTRGAAARTRAAPGARPIAGAAAGRRVAPVRGTAKAGAGTAVAGGTGPADAAALVKGRRTEGPAAAGGSVLTGRMLVTRGSVAIAAPHSTVSGRPDLTTRGGTGGSLQRQDGTIASQGATLDASGRGGTRRIGGDARGLGVLPEAPVNTAGAAATTIAAGATDRGEGGHVTPTTIGTGTPTGSKDGTDVTIGAGPLVVGNAGSAGARGTGAVLDHASRVHDGPNGASLSIPSSSTGVTGATAGSVILTGPASLAGAGGMALNAALPTPPLGPTATSGGISTGASGPVTLGAAANAIATFAGASGGGVVFLTGTPNVSGVTGATAATKGGFRADDARTGSGLPRAPLGDGVGHATAGSTVGDTRTTNPPSAPMAGNAVTVTGFVNGETGAVPGGRASQGGTAQGAIETGPDTLTASGRSSSNAVPRYGAGTLAIAQAPPKITAAVARADGQTLALESGASLSGALHGSDSVKEATLASFGARASAVAGLANRLSSFDDVISDAPWLLRVAPVSPAAASGASKTHDGLAFDGGKGVTLTGFVAGATRTVLAGRVSLGDAAWGAVDAGRHILTASGLSSSINALSSSAGSLMVEQAPLTITATTGKTSGEALDPGSACFTTATLYGNDSVTGAMLISVRAWASKAGLSPIMVSATAGRGLASSGLSYAPGPPAVWRAPLTVAADAAGKTRDGLADRGGIAVPLTGWVNRESASVLGGRASDGGTARGSFEAGSVILTTSGLSVSGNAPSDGPARLELAQASLVFTAKDASQTGGRALRSGGGGTGTLDTGASPPNAALATGSP